jgi:methionyl-tRNA formyltransferase
MWLGMIKVNFSFPDFERCIIFSFYRFDIGNIVLQESCPIAPTDTAQVLKARLSELGSRLLQESLRDLPHCLHRAVPQPKSGITYGMSLDSFS